MSADIQSDPAGRSAHEWRSVHTRVVDSALNVDAAGALARYEGSPLLAAGKLTLIGLDAIAERLAGRWAMRQDQVYQHVERTLSRRLDDQSHFLRVSECDYLVVQPAATRAGAQALCLSCLRDLLQHFLGETNDVDLTICQVTSVSARGLEASPVDPRAIAQAESQERHAAREKSVVGSPEDWTPFISADGRRVRVSCALEPVFQLKTHARIGYRMARRVVSLGTDVELTDAQMRGLARGDMENVDMATIARGLGRLAGDADGAMQPSLIIPVSFISLSSQRGRVLLSKAFDEAKARVKQGVICEVLDIEDVPPGALLAAASLIRPFCLFVVGRVRDPGAYPIANLKNAGLQGVSFVCPPGLAGDAEFLGWAKAAIGAAKRVARSVLVYGLATPRRAAIAEVLGATHASLRPASTVVLDS
jgi:hypothetical protein